MVVLLPVEPAQQSGSWGTTSKVVAGKGENPTKKYRAILITMGRYLLPSPPRFPSRWDLRKSSLSIFFPFEDLLIFFLLGLVRNWILILFFLISSNSSQTRVFFAGGPGKSKMILLFYSWFLNLNLNLNLNLL